MSLEKLDDLIADVQTITRSEAILPSYSASIDVPRPAPLRDAISLLELSAEHLRCKHCNGPLLNGAGSITCLFCGTVPVTRPDSIYFSSTIACGWFLDSLHLNGSEAVRPPNEDATQAGWGKNVSKLLELEIKWTALVQKSINNEKILGGLDFEGVGRSLNESDPIQSQQEDGWEADFLFVGGPDSVQSQPKGALGDDTAKIHPLKTVDSDQFDLVFGSNGKQNGNSTSTASVDFDHLSSPSKKHDRVNNDARLVLSEVDWFEEGQKDTVNKDNAAVDDFRMSNVDSDPFSIRKSDDLIVRSPDGISNDAEASAPDVTNWETTTTGQDLDTIMSRTHDLSFMLQPKLSLSHQKG